MYKDNELYEINIDKLAYSLENNTNIKVSDYIDYSDKIFSIERMKLTQKQLEEVKSQLKIEIVKIHNAVRETMASGNYEFTVKFIEKYGHSVKNELDKCIRKSIIMENKDKFVNNMLQIIYSNDDIKFKNKILADGAPIMYYKTENLRKLVGENAASSIFSMVLKGIKFAVMAAIPITFIQSGGFAKPVFSIVAVLFHLSFASMLDWIPQPKHPSANKLKYVKNEAKALNSFNRYFKVKWDNNAKVLLGRATSNILASEYVLKMYPKFKLTK